MKAMIVALALLLMCSGCWNGGNGSYLPLPELTPENLQLLISMFPYGGDLDSGFKSPTCPHDEASEYPEMHKPAMGAVAMLVPQMFGPQAAQELKTFCSSTEGATGLVAFSDAVCCPVAKGLLIYGGWTLTEEVDPDGGHPDYIATHGDGRRIPPL